MSEEPQTYTEVYLGLLLQKVDAYRERTGRKDSTVGRAALNDSMFVLKLREGSSNPTIAKLKQLEEWLDENTPEMPELPAEAEAD